jgi:2,5-diketo-D-gluconate reductase A
MEYVDLYLIHWPSPARGDAVAAWRGLLELHEAGIARSIGVSNFEVEHLERVADATGVMPTLNQVELHPYFQQRELRDFHARHGIATEAWSPLGQGGPLLGDPVFVEIAEAHGRTPAQVVLRWHLQVGNVVIPKSVTPERIAQNFDVFGFELSADDMARIAQLDRADGRIGPVPSLATF